MNVTASRLPPIPSPPLPPLPTSLKHPLHLLETSSFSPAALYTSTPFNVSSTLRTGHWPERPDLELRGRRRRWQRRWRRSRGGGGGRREVKFPLQTQINTQVYCDAASIIAYGRPDHFRGPTGWFFFVISLPSAIVYTEICCISIFLNFTLKKYLFSLALRFKVIDTQIYIIILETIFGKFCIILKIQFFSNKNLTFNLKYPLTICTIFKLMRKFWNNDYEF